MVLGSHVVDPGRTRNCLFLELDLCRNATTRDRQKHVREEEQVGSYETLAPIRSASLRADTSDDCKYIWLEHQTRRISASNVTAGRMEHDGRCTGSVEAMSFRTR